MRVVEVDRRGGPEVLSVAEREAPRPGPGQVVVDVAAAGVNFMDIYQRQGVGGYEPELPFVPGAEGAGTVAAVGEGVTHLSVGDPVAWAGPGSSYAEQVALPASRVVPVPARDQPAGSRRGHAAGHHRALPERQHLPGAAKATWQWSTRRPAGSACC